MTEKQVSLSEKRELFKPSTNIHICEFKHGKLKDALFNKNTGLFRCRRCFNIVPLTQVSLELYPKQEEKLR